MRWILWFFLGFVVLVLGTAGLVYTTDVVETWAVKALKGTVTSSDVTQLDFDSLDYLPPNTVAIKDLTVGLDEATIQASAVTLRVNALNRSGIEVDLVEIDAPVFEQRQPKQSDEASANDNGAIDEPVAAARQKSTAAFSVQLRQLILKEGIYRYYPANSSRPIELPNINLSVKADKSQVIQQGVYDMSASANLMPVVDLAIAGKVKLAELALHLDSAHLHLDIGKLTSKHGWPVTWEDSVKPYMANAKIKTHFAGMFKLLSPTQSDLRGQLTIEDMTLPVGDAVLPISAVTADYKLAQKHLMASTLQAKFTKGTLVMTETDLDFSQDLQPLETNWQLDDFDLAQLTSKDKEVVGILKSKGKMVIELNGARIKEGVGTAAIRQAKLINVPIVSELVSVMDLGNLVKGKIAQNDTVDAKFSLHAHHLDFQTLKLDSVLLTARAKGKVHYDGQLDLIANAGPIEKVGSLLGKIGEIANTITDQVLAYKITGTAKKPKVRPVVLGIGG